jgi:thiamine pyrophosphate-dependent acetolactate synthase large subunit-like protein
MLSIAFHSPPLSRRRITKHDPPHNDRGVDAMDPIIAALAQAAGLDKALTDFPDDVEAAAQQALKNAGVIQVPTDPAAEPWPPMRAGIGL